MFSKLLKLKLVGQLKSLYHYMRSDNQACRIAVRVSSRSTILWSACALGSAFGGPVGADIGAIVCGLLTEAVLPESDGDPAAVPALYSNAERSRLGFSSPLQYDAGVLCW